MAGRISGHVRSNAIAYVALFVALGGGAYAANHINGRTIVRRSTPGNRLKNDTVTGKQVKESSLKKPVPKAKDSRTLRGIAPAGLGQGIVSGGIDKPANGTQVLTPYGVFEPGDASIEAKAPVAMHVRDFVAEAVSGFSAGDSLAFSIQITDPTSGITSVPLCTISNAQLTCRANGPVAIAKGDVYRIETLGTNLDANETAGYQYRAAAG